MSATSRSFGLVPGFFCTVSAWARRWCSA